MLIIHFILGYLLIEGILYLIFPQAVQNFATRNILDSHIENLRQWGLFCLVVFVLGCLVFLR